MRDGVGRRRGFRHALVKSRAERRGGGGGLGQSLGMHWSLQGKGGVSTTE